MGEGTDEDVLEEFVSGFRQRAGLRHRSDEVGLSFRVVQHDQVAFAAGAEAVLQGPLTTEPLLLIRRAQEVGLSMLPEGAALYYVPEGERWFSWVQHGTLRSPELQKVCAESA